MVDVIEFLAATGCRVGEVCGLQWDAVDLDAGTVTIRANVVRAHGQGVVVQDHAKTRAGTRTIAIPPHLVRVLRRRRARSSSGRRGSCSPRVAATSGIRGTRRGRGGRRASGSGFPAVSTHSFRKTVATALDRGGAVGAGRSRSTSATRTRRSRRTSTWRRTRAGSALPRRSTGLLELVSKADSRQ